jgi:hypothetical protein
MIQALKARVRNVISRATRAITRLDARWRRMLIRALFEANA